MRTAGERPPLSPRVPFAGRGRGRGAIDVRQTRSDRILWDVRRSPLSPTLSPQTDAGRGRNAAIQPINLMRRMKIILANPRGFCAGVNMAIECVDQVLRTRGAPVYVYH